MLTKEAPYFYDTTTVTTYPISPERLQTIVHTASVARIVNSMVVSSSALLLYDYLLTLSDEVKYIWSADWNAGKILFFLNRYIWPISVLLQLNQYLNKGLSDQTCVLSFQIEQWIGFLPFLASQAILVLRTYALSTGSYRIWVFLWTVFGVCALALFGLIVRVSVALESNRAPGSTPIVRACYYKTDSSALFGMWVPNLTFQLVLFCWNVWHFLFEHLSGLGSLPPLVQVLYRDGFIYIAIVFGFTLANHVVYLKGPLGYRLLLTPMLEVMTSICCTRMFLHLHGSILKTSGSRQTSTAVELSTFHVFRRHGTESSLMGDQEVIEA